MPEVSEIEQVEMAKNQTAEPGWDSWTIEIPAEIIKAQSLAEGSLATFTVKDGRIEGEIITPSAKLKEISRRIFEENKEVYEELKRLGD